MGPDARRQAYRSVSELASLEEASALTKDRSVLLLWFLRNAVGLEEFDAYDYICDGDDDAGVDALYLEERQGDEDVESLVVYQSYFTTSPKEIGPGKLNELLAAASTFKTEGALTALLDGKVEAPLRRLIARYRLVEKLARGDLTSRCLRLRLVLVTTGILNAAARRRIAAVNAAEGDDSYLTVYDLERLHRLAAVVAAPESHVARLVIRVPRRERLVLTSGGNGNRVAIVPVKASEIAQWNGVEDRKLFALNVRGELKRNTVSKQLDAAIQRTHDHADFLASHNGMTMTCDRFDDANAREITVERPSIVNGAQSATAFLRGHVDGAMTPDLRIFVKLVEVQGRPQFANSVSSRSNTQNAVSPRNLVANTGPQRRLLAEFEERFPGIYYEVKPDARTTTRLRREGTPIITNDDAAQLLCAVYVEEPWLAVKRTLLFAPDEYRRIFRQDIHAEHVVLVDELGKLVDHERARIPERYRKSWRLTRLTTVYLLSQVMRTSDELSQLLDRPMAALQDRDLLRRELKRPLAAAILTLRKRKDRFDRNQAEEESPEDDFRVAFKNREELRALRDRAREEYLTIVEVENLDV